MGEYETQAFVARHDDTHRGFVWRCARCGRYIGVIEALDGSLEIMHKCGARNRLAGSIDGGTSCLPGDPAAHITDCTAARHDDETTTGPRSEKPRTLRRA